MSYTLVSCTKSASINSIWISFEKNKIKNIFFLLPILNVKCESKGDILNLFLLENNCVFSTLNPLLLNLLKLIKYNI